MPSLPLGVSHTGSSFRVTYRSDVSQDETAHALYLLGEELQFPNHRGSNGKSRISISQGKHPLLTSNERFFFLCWNLIFLTQYYFDRGFPGDSVVKNPSAMQKTQETQVPSLVWEDPPVEGNGNPLQYSCLEISIDRGD